MPKHNSVTEDVAVVIQHVLLLRVSAGADGLIWGIDTRERLRTLSGLLAYYLTSFKQVWVRSMSRGCMICLTMTLWTCWVSEQVRENPSSRHERSLLRLCWAWASSDSDLAT